MVIIISENENETEQGIIKNDVSYALNVHNQDEESEELLYEKEVILESNDFVKEISKVISVMSEGNIKEMKNMSWYKIERRNT